MQSMIDYINDMNGGNGGNMDNMISLINEPYISKEQLKQVNLNFEKVYKACTAGKKENEFKLKFNHKE